MGNSNYSLSGRALHGICFGIFVTAYVHLFFQTLFPPFSACAELFVIFKTEIPKV